MKRSTQQGKKKTGKGRGSDMKQTGGRKGFQSQDDFTKKSAKNRGK